MPLSGPQEEQARLRALVRGKVQGVYFRDFARGHARRLAVVGWVQNLPDGATVEVVAEGPRVRLGELLAHLHEGPPRAHVTQVDAEWGSPSGEFRSFDVR